MKHELKEGQAAGNDLDRLGAMAASIAVIGRVIARRLTGKRYGLYSSQKNV